MSSPATRDLREVFSSHEFLADPAAVGRIAHAARAEGPTTATKAGTEGAEARAWWTGRRTALVGAALAVAVVVAAGSIGLLSAPRPAPTVPAGPPPSAGPFAVQATTLLQRYAELTAAAAPPALSVAGPLDGTEGTLEPSIGGSYKLSITTGHLTAPGPLPTGPTEGTVTMLATSARVSTPLMTASQTLDALRGTPRECRGCSDVVVTTAIPTTMVVELLGGRARVPAWEFVLQGTSFRMIRAAIPARSLVSMESGATRLRGTLGVTSFTASADGHSLDLEFVGAAEAGPCGKRYTASAYESSLAVVVAIADAGPTDTDPPTSAQYCPDVGLTRHVSVEVSRPLGRRAVLDLAWGQLVRLTGPQPGRVTAP